MKAASAYLPLLGLVVLLSLVPLFVQSNVVLNFMVFTLIIAVAAQGWNVLGGFGGQFSFGHAAFFGIGAYVSCLWQMRLGLDPWTGFAAGILAGALVCLVVAQWIRGSRFGAQLVALKENEEAAKALGIDVLAVKLKAIAISGAMTAAAGALYLQYFLYIDSNIAFGNWISVEVLLAAMVGGLGTVMGPVLGALALHGIGELAKTFAGAVPGIDLAVYGAILIIAVAFLPGGLLGLVKRRRRRGPGAPTAVSATVPAGERA